jgi:hypothetical protein
MVDIEAEGAQVLTPVELHPSEGGAMRIPEIRAGEADWLDDTNLVGARRNAVGLEDALGREDGRTIFDSEDESASRLVMVREDRPGKGKNLRRRTRKPDSQILG